MTLRSDTDLTLEILLNVMHCSKCRYWHDENGFYFAQPYAFKPFLDIDHAFMILKYFTKKNVHIKLMGCGDVWSCEIKDAFPCSFDSPMRAICMAALDYEGISTTEEEMP